MHKTRVVCARLINLHLGQHFERFLLLTVTQLHLDRQSYPRVLFTFDSIVIRLHLVIVLCLSSHIDLNIDALLLGVYDLHRRVHGLTITL